MAYEIIAFDGVALPIYLQRGDEQNMGTGSAQTDFRQTPGGGFYRMRRTARSPQGIRPVTKSAVLWGTNAEVHEQLDDLRAKIGVYGKLTIAYFDGVTRWQWAELQDVDAPTAAKFKGGFLPVSLTWQTAAQNWNGNIQGSGWTWGDGSWTWGDGTAEFGQNSFEYDLDDDTSSILSVSHAGTIDATNLVLTLTAFFTQTTVIFVNGATAQRITWTGQLNIAESLRVSTRDMTIVKLGYVRNIASVARAVNTVTVTTSNPHGLVTGDDVEIYGTDEYNGVWPDVTVASAYIFTFTVTGNSTIYGNEYAGTLRKYTDEYANATFGDVQRWMVLAPGANDFQVQTDQAQTSATMLFEFWDAYA